MRKSTEARLDDIVARHRFAEAVYVTRPSLPDLDAYRDKLEPVWQSAWLTNAGRLHDEFRDALAGELGVPHLSLCCNGTMALLLALQAARISGGEVITTPFTFPATVHALYWNRVQPVFCDIEEESLNLDPARVEGLIGPDTRAILAVHVFGNPCDVEALEEIANRHGLAVLYDAAHAMGVRYRGRSILHWGNYSVLSFHATKLFTTAEGGAVVSGSEIDRERVDFMKNFGIADEETVIGPGINGKLNELQAALGLLQLEGLREEIERRGELAALYRELLAPVAGIRLVGPRPEVESNYAYLPVQVDPDAYGMTRDELSAALRRCNVFPRKYFHPLCSRYPSYSSLPSARPEALPVAERVASRALCLPLYGTLPKSAVERIGAIVAELADGG